MTLRFVVSGVIALHLLIPTPAFAGPEDDSLRVEIGRLREEMRAMEKRHGAELRRLREQLDRRAPEGSELSEAIDALAVRTDALENAVAARHTERPLLRLVDVSLGSLFTGGLSNRGDDTIAALQAGGHDPNRRGFTVQNVELALKGTVDPYFTAQANLVALIDRDGGSVVELEEAFATTTGLPWGFQAKAGQFYTAFGRHNPQHPHAWEFVDQPFGLTRFLGPDGMRGPGAQASWLAPTGFPLELTAALQNANGETMASFLGADAEDEGDHGHGSVATTFGASRQREVRSLDDLVGSGRATASFGLSDEWTTLFGASTAYGPNQAGGSAETWLHGIDVTARWEPHDTHHGIPFVELRSELVGRDYEFDAFTDDAGDAFPRGALHDRTWYLQGVWGLAPHWTVGARHERFWGDAPEELTGLEDRTRWSLAITHDFSENSKVRLQVNRDDSDTLGQATSVWLQLEVHLGSHAAHSEENEH